MTLSPPTGCDLSPGFHLSAPWSPLARRGSWGGGSGTPRHRRRASPLGNRPRTFSEYSAGPPSVGSPVPPHLQERSASANDAGLSFSSSSSAVWGRGGGGEDEDEDEDEGGRGGRGGGGGGERRARSFTCGSGNRDPFAGWAGIGGRVEEEEAVAVAAAATGKSGGGGGKVDGENGGIGRPASPFHRRHHRSRPYFGR